MKVGDLVRAKEASVIGIVIKKTDEVRFSEDEGVDYQYLVQWFQPPVKTWLKTKQSWRISKHLELLSEGR